MDKRKAYRWQFFSDEKLLQWKEVGHALENDHAWPDWWQYLGGWLENSKIMSLTFDQVKRKLVAELVVLAR